MLKPPVDAPIDVKDWIDNRPIAAYQWLILVLCFLIVLFDGFDVAVMGFIAPSLMQDWGLSRAAFGPVMSAGMVGLAIGALTAGPYADRLGRKKVLLIAVSGFSLLSLACAFARNPYELAVLRLLTGIALGAAMPNCTTLLAEYLPTRNRSLMIDHHHVHRLQHGLGPGRLPVRLADTSSRLEVGTAGRRPAATGLAATAVVAAARVRSLPRRTPGTGQPDCGSLGQAWRPLRCRHPLYRQ